MRLARSGKWAYGKWTKKFEEAFAAVCGTRYAVAMGSGTQALEVMVRALRLRGKRIAIPVNGYIAHAQAVLHAGAFVHFVDVTDDLMLDPKKLPKTDDAVDAVLTVHIGGNISGNLGAIQDYCKARNLPLLEDAAHAHGSTSSFGKAGAIGHAAGFSFFPTKILTVAGEGGMLTTSDPEVATFAQRFRHHGRENPGHDDPNVRHVIQGHNYSIDEVRSLMGWLQVNRLREFIEARRQVAAVYREKFPLIETEGTNFYKCIVPDKVKAPFDLPGKVYGVPCHLQPAFGYKKGMFPVAEAVCANHSCLPIYNSMTEEEARAIVRELKP
jgi:dTDP-4-amino-4,6-dideoxygalactose transaminase